MLLNLKAEFARKNIDSVKAIIDVLGCSEKTARNKLNCETEITVPEAVKIRSKYFKYDNFDFEYLFADISTPVNDITS